jgi:hypothetical protein
VAHDDHALGVAAKDQVVRRGRASATRRWPSLAINRMGVAKENCGKKIFATGTEPPRG